MPFNRSVKCLTVLLITTAQFYYFRRLGAPPSGEMTLLLVLVNFSLVSAIQLGWRWYTARRRQHWRPRTGKTITIEEEVDDENSDSH